MTPIPYEVEPVAVGPATGEQIWKRGSVKKQNDKGAFPNDTNRYTIKCRLRIDRYTRPEAYDRCREIHGHTFDGMFMSGSFYVFFRKA